MKGSVNICVVDCVSKFIVSSNGDIMAPEYLKSIFLEIWNI